jgi:hypothetical protein
MSDDSDDDANDSDDGEPRGGRRVKCCRCGKPTRFDPVYEDLCGDCCRTSNE